MIHQVLKKCIYVNLNILLEFLFHAKPENHPKNSPLYQIKSYTLFIECI